ncbi:MAG: hypothetical protein GXY68_05920 [Chloroflexi bacterium]|jgi:hypothetical protein|nr:hypothetical protein [Chloroflexota bacterium]
MKEHFIRVATPFVVAILISSLLIVGCARKRELRPLAVEAVAVDIGTGSPIPVEIVAGGTWPDLCAQLARVETDIDGYEIQIALLASPVQTGCPPDYVGVPFRVAVPLNPVELPEGRYTATVNGVAATFDWPLP